MKFPEKIQNVRKNTIQNIKIYLDIIKTTLQSDETQVERIGQTDKIACDVKSYRKKRINLTCTRIGPRSLFPPYCGLP